MNSTENCSSQEEDEEEEEEEESDDDCGGFTSSHSFTRVGTLKKNGKNVSDTAASGRRPVKSGGGGGWRQIRSVLKTAQWDRRRRNFSTQIEQQQQQCALSAGSPSGETPVRSGSKLRSALWLAQASHVTSSLAKKLGLSSVNVPAQRVASPTLLISEQSDSIFHSLEQHFQQFPQQPRTRRAVSLHGTQDLPHIVLRRTPSLEPSLQLSPPPLTVKDAADDVFLRAEASLGRTDGADVGALRRQTRRSSRNSAPDETDKEVHPTFHRFLIELNIISYYIISL